MAAGTYLLLAALLLATAVTLLVATSTVPVSAAAAAADKYSGRMVILRAPGARVVVSAGGALNKRQQRRLVEDEVAPELGSGLLGAGIGYGALNPNKQVCVPKCANPGQRYTPGHCTYENHCPQGPTPDHARNMHA